MAKGMMVPAAKTTRKAGDVSAKGNPFAAMNKPAMPTTGRDQMVGGPGMPKLNRGGMIGKKGKKK